MNCEDVLAVLQRGGNDLARREATEHLASCKNCRAAAHAVTVLKADRDLLIHPPRDGALHDAIRAAVSTSRRVAPKRTGFWLGVGVGAALAASVAAAFVMLLPSRESPLRGVPSVTLVINQVRDVNVALSSPEPLPNAEIRVALSGDIGLRGLADQRELRWRADLDRGVNQLALPIVALGPHGGQVLVEVQHGDKHRAFVVDVRAVAPSADVRASKLHLAAAPASRLWTAMKPMAGPLVSRSMGDECGALG